MRFRSVHYMHDLGAKIDRKVTMELPPVYAGGHAGVTGGSPGRPRGVLMTSGMELTATTVFTIGFTRHCSTSQVTEAVG